MKCFFGVYTKFNKIGFRNSILILRVVITTNSTQVDKFLNLPNSASPSYTTTMREPVQSFMHMLNFYHSYTLFLMMVYAVILKSLA